MGRIYEAYGDAFPIAGHLRIERKPLPIGAPVTERLEVRSTQLRGETLLELHRRIDGQGDDERALGFLFFAECCGRPPDENVQASCFVSRGTARFERLSRQIVSVL